MPHKRRLVANSLREMIASLSVGDRLPSVPELERHFSVAKSTIEAAVGELQAEGLLVRRQGSGTFVAQTGGPAANRRVKSGRIVITSVGTPPTSNIFGSMTAALEVELRRHGYESVLVLDDDPAMRLSRVKEQWEADDIAGYIHIGSLSIQEYPPVPGVIIGEVPEGARVHQVVVDNYGAGRRVGEYLMRLGHRRVAFIATPGLIPAVPRFEGLCDALCESGANIADIRQVTVPWGVGVSDVPHLDAALEQLLAGPNAPTAFFFGNDQIALPGLQALLAWGHRVPQEISVVSFDDTPGLAEYTRPALTSMRMPVLSLAALAVQSLHQELSAPGSAIRSLRIQAELIVRDSTGPVGPSQPPGDGK